MPAFFLASVHSNRMQHVGNSTDQADFQQRILAVNQCNPYHLHLRTCLRCSACERVIIFEYENFNGLSWQYL